VAYNAVTSAEYQQRNCAANAEYKTQHTCNKTRLKARADNTHNVIHTLSVHELTHTLRLTARPSTLHRQPTSLLISAYYFHIIVKNKSSITKLYTCICVSKEKCWNLLLPMQSLKKFLYLK